MENSTATTARRRGGFTGLALQLLLLTLIAVLLGLIVWRQWGSDLPLQSPSGYYAIVLTNGQGFYARVDRANADYLELSDLWSIKQVVNPETKQTNAVLSRRADEVYAPQQMVVLRSSLAFLEPVGEKSEIATKIKALSARTGN